MIPDAALVEFGQQQELNQTDGKYNKKLELLLYNTVSNEHGRAVAYRRKKVRPRKTKREKESEKERGKNREKGKKENDMTRQRTTDRQTDRETERQTEKETERQRKTRQDRQQQTENRERERESNWIDRLLRLTAVYRPDTGGRLPA